jgi:hypothetical protein
VRTVSLYKPLQYQALPDMDQRARNVEHLMRGANSLLQCLAVESAAADVSRRKAQMDGQTVGQTVGQPVSRCKCSLFAL